MDAGTIIAEAIFLFSEHNKKGTLNIRIEKPTQQPDKIWLCLVHLDGLPTDSEFSISGDSSLQALALCIKFIATHITNQMKAGTLTLAFSDGTDCDIDTIKAIFGI